MKHILLLFALGLNLLLTGCASNPQSEEPTPQQINQMREESKISRKDAEAAAAAINANPRLSAQQKQKALQDLKARTKS